MSETHYIKCYAERFRNRLITLLGGPDPVTVKYLTYRAKLLAGMVPALQAPNEGYRTLVNAQVKAIHQAASILDQEEVRNDS